MKYNDMYNKGFNRIGCLICPYQSDVVELLIKNHYPKQWKRWVDILAKGYEIYGVERRLKWDLLEWCEGGRWKSATSKESELTTKKATPERIKELAELKGISEEMAVKYFKKESVTKKALLFATPFYYLFCKCFFQNSCSAQFCISANSLPSGSRKLQISNVWSFSKGACTCFKISPA